MLSVSPHPAIGAHDEQWTHHFTTAFMVETTTVGNSFWKEVAFFFPAAEHSVLLSLQLYVRITLWDSLSSLTHPPVPAASMRGGSQAAWPLPWFSLAHVTLLSVWFGLGWVVFFQLLCQFLVSWISSGVGPTRQRAPWLEQEVVLGNHQPFETAATDELDCHKTVLWGALTPTVCVHDPAHRLSLQSVAYVWCLKRKVGKPIWWVYSDLNPSNRTI